MNTGADGIERLREQISLAIADEQASARLQGLRGGLTRLKSAAEGVSIAIGTSLLPALTSATQAFTQALGPINTFVEAYPKLSKGYERPVLLGVLLGGSVRG